MSIANMNIHSIGDFSDFLDAWGDSRYRMQLQIGCHYLLMTPVVSVNNRLCIHVILYFGHSFPGLSISYVDNGSGQYQVVQNMNEH